MKVRSLFYTAARLLGDIRAIRQGKFAKRVLRRAVLRKTGSIINRIIK